MIAESRPTASLPKFLSGTGELRTRATARASVPIRANMFHSVPVVNVEVGATLGARYLLTARLGEGGTATAFRARDARDGAEVALKIRRPSAGAEVREAFEREFERLRGVHHPHLATVHDFGVDRAGGAEPIVYIVSDLVDGETMSRFALGSAGGPTRWEAIERAFLDALEGLLFLHRLGIAHGDVKPDNVMVDARGRGVLIDLGCSRLFGEPPSLAVSGTHGFIAPELLAGRHADARADVYSAGVALQALSPPRALRALVTRMTSASPTDRPSGVAEVLEALGRRASSIGPPGGRAPRLIGRAREVAVVRSLVDAVCAGAEAPRVLVVHGPPGIGRTRLLRETEWMAQPRCAVVSAFPRESAEPIAGLRRLLGDDTLRPGVDGLLEARARIAARGEPCVLIVDDLDALDPEARVVWRAFIRMARSDDRCLFVCASTEPLDGRSGVVENVSLGPLGATDIVEWAERSLTSAQAERLHAHTGGYPAAIEAVLGALTSGGTTIGRLSATSWDARGVIAAQVDAAEEPELCALALLASCDGTVDDRDAAALDADLASPELAGLVLRAPIGWTLRRRIDAPAIAEALAATERGRSALRAVHGALADRLAGSVDHDPLRTARRLGHLFGAGRSDEALRLLVSLVPHAEEAPAALARVLDDPFVRGVLRDDAEASLAASAMLRGAGEPRRALGILAALLRGRPDASVIALLRLEAAGAYLRLGEPRRAERELRAMSPLDPEQRARRADLLSRALVALGRAREAWDVALAVLGGVRAAGAGGPRTSTIDDALPAELAARLHEDLGVAATYLGDGAAARQHFASATRLVPDADARTRIRIASYQGIAAFREGDSQSAAACYRQALALAEQYALDDQLPTVLLNVGTAAQLAGDLGEALASYERGLLLAEAIGKRSTELTLRFNLANLHVVIGLADRAAHIVDDVEVLAREERMAHFETACTALRGEIALLRGRPDAAARAFAAAAEAHAAVGSGREAAEARVHLAVALRAGGDLDGAARAVAEVLRRTETADVRARALLESGRIDRARGRPTDALRSLEDAQRLASNAGDRLLEAEIEAELAACAEAAGAVELAASRRARARALLDRIAITLPAEMRDAFERAPARAVLASRTEGALATDAARVQLERILEINKRIGASSSVDEVLERALDAAIELSGAERGFILVGGGSELRAAVARNIDRERIGRSHDKFSRGIAERVIRTGEPIVTVDAQDDTRFRGNRSVHAMRLTSVACVPIRAPDGVLGAIYVDNRFRRGRFEERDAWILLAFADQVSIALRNARQTAELAARTRELEARTAELEAERDRVRTLFREQERDLDRVTAEAEARQRALAQRYDYSQIVGGSPPMRRLFSLVDRVVDPSIDVLIQGESGTGKELVARAIHFNGPRAERPFVAVNCAALPEALLESELFGHVKGAFTGADRARTGLFVSAHSGTIFLDEIGETPPSMQAKLLRVLQERRVRPVGATDSLAVDVRVLTATNRTLEDEVAAGRFREDLYYRLAVVTLQVPPLRERVEDIPDLARRIVERAADAHRRRAPAVGADAIRALMAHDWPGNVRELENVLTRGLLLCDGDTLRARHIAFPEGPRPVAQDRRAHDAREADRIRGALDLAGWNVSAASRRLGIPRNTLYRKMRRYGIHA